MRQKSQSELERPDAASAKAAERMPLIFVLENVRSGNNVGAVLRSADAFAVQEVVCVGFTPTPPHREILKASLGAEESVPWRHFDDMRACLEALRQNGTRVYALEQTTGSVPLAGLGFGGGPDVSAGEEHGLGAAAALAIVLGNEVRGVSAETLESVDGAIEIPQFGMKHSLNVSVAAGIVAYVLRIQWDARPRQ